MCYVCMYRLGRKRKQETCRSNGYTTGNSRSNGNRIRNMKKCHNCIEKFDEKDERALLVKFVNWFEDKETPSNSGWFKWKIRLCPRCTQDRSVTMLEWFECTGSGKRTTLK